MVAHYAGADVVAIIVVVLRLIWVDAAGEGAEEGHEGYIGRLVGFLLGVFVEGIVVVVAWWYRGR